MKFFVTCTLEVHDGSQRLAIETAKHILNAVPFDEMPGSWLALPFDDTEFPEPGRKK